MIDTTHGRFIAWRCPHCLLSGSPSPPSTARRPPAVARHAARVGIPAGRHGQRRCDEFLRRTCRGVGHAGYRASTSAHLLASHPDDRANKQGPEDHERRRKDPQKGEQVHRDITGDNARNDQTQTDEEESRSSQTKQRHLEGEGHGSPVASCDGLVTLSQPAARCAQGGTTWPGTRAVRTSRGSLPPRAPTAHLGRARLCRGPAGVGGGCPRLNSRGFPRGRGVCSIVLRNGGSAGERKPVGKHSADLRKAPADRSVMGIVSSPGLQQRTSSVDLEPVEGRRFFLKIEGINSPVR